jgi:hypothetical protein
MISIQSVGSVDNVKSLYGPDQKTQHVLLAFTNSLSHLLLDQSPPPRAPSHFTPTSNLEIILITSHRSVVYLLFHIILSFLLSGYYAFILSSFDTVTKSLPFFIFFQTSYSMILFHHTTLFIITLPSSSQM